MTKYFYLGLTTHGSPSWIGLSLVLPFEFVTLNHKFQNRVHHPRQIFYRGPEVQSENFNLLK